MAEKTEPFFKQLYKLSHHIDSSITELNGKLEEKINPNCDNTKSLAILHDTKKEVKQLKKDAQTTFVDFSCSGKNFGRVLSACQNFLDSSRNQLNHIEEHLSSYGYTKPVEVGETEENNNDNEEEDDNKEEEDEDFEKSESKDNSTPSPSKPRKPDLTRTPKLEGLSKYGMQAMFRYQQNKQSSARPTEIKEVPMEPPGHYNRFDSVPQAFQHNGLTVTPSIVGMFQWPPQTPDSCTPAPNFKKGMYYQNNTFSPEVFKQNSTRDIDSLEQPAFCTPAINQVNKIPMSNIALPQPLFTTDLDSPAHPVFQTPGMKYSGNLIKESQKQSEILENKVSRDYDLLEEPELPELTMTYQDITKATNYGNKKRTEDEEITEPQKPSGLKTKFGYDADTATPPHLELLSSRLIKMGIAPSNSPYKTPPQPTLLSKYKRRGNRENIAP